MAQPKHMCGLQGFDSYLGDRCPGCDYSPTLQEMEDEFAVDPSEKSVYDSRILNSNESRSNTMSGAFEAVCDWCGESGHDEDNCMDQEGIEDNELQVFLGKLETFLIDELDDASRGNVFLSETGDDKVGINILVGAPFEGSGLEVDCTQINIIIAPTDRKLLGSEGVSIDDSVDGSFESDEAVEQSEKHSWFDAAMRIFRND